MKIEKEEKEELEVQVKDRRASTVLSAKFKNKSGKKL